jgi:hypothetical protein
MVLEYESQSIFRQEQSNSVCEYDTTPIEYDSIMSPVDYCLDKWDCSYISIIIIITPNIKPMDNSDALHWLYNIGFFNYRFCGYRIPLYTDYIQ